MFHSVLTIDRNTFYFANCYYKANVYSSKEKLKMPNIIETSLTLLSHMFM